MRMLMGEQRLLGGRAATPELETNRIGLPLSAAHPAAGIA